MRSLFPLHGLEAQKGTPVQLHLECGEIILTKSSPGLKAAVQEQLCRESEEKKKRAHARLQICYLYRNSMSEVGIIGTRYDVPHKFLINSSPRHTQKGIKVKENFASELQTGTFCSSRKQRGKQNNPPLCQKKRREPHAQPWLAKLPGWSALKAAWKCG